MPKVYSFFLILSSCLLVSPAMGKSLRELRIGKTQLGYHFSGGVDANIGGTNYDAGYHGIFIGLRQPFRSFFNDQARLTWDSAFEISILSVDSDILKGSRYAIRTGLGYEYLFLEEWLMKLELGVDVARVSTSSESTTFPGEDESWKFGGHLNGSIMYNANQNFTLFGTLGVETFGSQEFQSIEVDPGGSISFSTGIYFPW
jgi:hypothetical protein